MPSAGIVAQVSQSTEMGHLREPTHGAKFLALFDNHYPAWREARAELNELPLAHPPE